MIGGILVIDIFLSGEDVVSCLLMLNQTSQTEITTAKLSNDFIHYVTVPNEIRCIFLESLTLREF